MFQQLRIYWRLWIIIAGLLWFATPSFSLTVGEQAPDFVAEDLSGRSIRLSEVWRNQVVILYFWDVRFRVCQQGLLDLQALRTQYPDSLAILAVNIDVQAHSQMRSFLVSHPQAENIGQLLLDTGGGSQRYDAFLSVPVSCVIDGNGCIAFYEQSFDIQKLRQVVSKLLSPQAPPGWYRASPKRIGLWGQRLWPFEDMRRGEVFQHWGNGDVFSIALLREGRAQWTFGLMACYHKNVREHYRENYIFMRENTSGSGTLLFGPPPWPWHRVGVSFSAGGLAVRDRWGRLAEQDQTIPKTTRSRISPDSVLQPELHTTPVKTPIYIVPVAGLSIRVYIIDAISLYAFGEVDLKTAVERGGDILKQYHSYRYEAGIRAYITRLLNLNIGYGQWRIGGLSVNGIQIAYGLTF